MTKLPPDIEVLEPLTGAYRETHYRLPPRSPDAVKEVFQSAIGGALVIAAIPFIFSIFFAVVVPRDKLDFYVIAILMPIVFFGSFLFPGAVAILIYGLTYRFGRTEVRCGPEFITVRSGWLIFRRTRRLPLAGLNGFRVQTGMLHVSSFLMTDPERAAPKLRDVGVLFADYATAPSKPICAGYRLDWLTSFAEELTRRCATSPLKSESLRPVTRTTTDPNQFVTRIEQPSTSDARVIVDGDTLILEHPARGFWRGVPGFLKLFGLFWNGFMVMWSFTFMPALFAGEVQWNDGPQKTSIWFGLLFCTPFYLVGFGFLVYFYYASIYTARWTVRTDELELWQRTLFSEQIQTWRLSELTAIRVASKQNNDEDKTWTTFLAIDTGEGKPSEFLGDRDKAELEWLATTLSKAAGLPLFNQQSSSAESLESS